MQVDYVVKTGNAVSITQDKPHEGFHHRVIAKKLLDVEQPRYYIALANTSILDPRQLSDREMKSQHTGFKQVGPEIYEKYLKYAMDPSAGISIKTIERMCI